MALAVFQPLAGIFKATEIKKEGLLLSTVTRATLVLLLGKNSSWGCGWTLLYPTPRNALSVCPSVTFFNVWACALDFQNFLEDDEDEDEDEDEEDICWICWQKFLDLSNIFLEFLIFSGFFGFFRIVWIFQDFLDHSGCFEFFRIFLDFSEFF